MKMEARTESPSRIDRIKEVHPTARTVWIHGMLVYKYKEVTRDPACTGPDGIQVQLENYTDYLMKLTPRAFLNEVARVSERFEVTWDELEDAMLDHLTDEDDD